MGRGNRKEKPAVSTIFTDSFIVYQDTEDQIGSHPDYAAKGRMSSRLLCLECIILGKPLITILRALDSLCKTLFIKINALQLQWNTEADFAPFEVHQAGLG